MHCECHKSHSPPPKAEVIVGQAREMGLKLCPDSGTHDPQSDDQLWENCYWLTEFIGGVYAA